MNHLMSGHSLNKHCLGIVSYMVFSFLAGLGNVIFFSLFGRFVRANRTWRPRGDRASILRAYDDLLVGRPHDDPAVTMRQPLGPS